MGRLVERQLHLLAKYWFKLLHFQALWQFALQASEPDSSQLASVDEPFVVGSGKCSGRVGVVQFKRTEQITLMSYRLHMQCVLELYIKKGLGQNTRGFCF